MYLKKLFEQNDDKFLLRKLGTYELDISEDDFVCIHGNMNNSSDNNNKEEIDNRWTKERWEQILG